MVLPFWYQLTQVVPEKKALNGCVSVCQYTCDIKIVVIISDMPTYTASFTSV